MSIILSAYNESSVILNAIKSIREQHFIDWELIVVNDGSTENKTKLLANLENLKSIQVINMRDIPNYSEKKGFNVTA